MITHDTNGYLSLLSFLLLTPSSFHPFLLIPHTRSIKVTSSIGHIIIKFLLPLLLLLPSQTGFVTYRLSLAAGGWNNSVFLARLGSCFSCIQTFKWDSHGEDSLTSGGAN